MTTADIAEICLQLFMKTNDNTSWRPSK